MQKLVLIDGHAIIHRAFHALPPLTTKDGKIVNAVYGFVSILLKVIEELKPTHLAVVFDTPKPTFRNKLSSDYQATRPKTDEKLISQFDLVHEVVNGMEIAHFETDGYEADDLIGTIADKVKSQKSQPKADQPRAEKVKIANKNSKVEEDTEVVIVTGDRDLLQLVSNKVKVYMPVKGLSQPKFFGVKDVEEKLGIKPSLVVDYKALVGDPSDNYPGVGGIGPKTAQELLNLYGSFENIFKNIDEIKSRSVKDKLIKGKKEGELSKQLATIVKDAPLDFDLDACELKQFDTPQVRWLFEELEFRSLIPRLSGRIKNYELGIKNEEKDKNKTEQIQLF